MITAFTVTNFKSYLEARLPLGPLTVLIGANASGKSNIIEALRLLSWLAQGQKLSSIQFAVHGSEKIIRGRVSDLPHLGGTHFGMGCETTLKEWNMLSLGLTLRDDGLHITQESITTPGVTVPLYTLDSPSTGVSSDVKVAYNNFSKGRNKPHIVCVDQMAIFTQLGTPARFDATHPRAQQDIPAVVRQYETWLSNILFLDPSPSRMRDYSYRSDKNLRGDGTNLSSVLFNLWGDTDHPASDVEGERRAAILNFIRSLPEQNIERLTFLKGPRNDVIVALEETFGGVARQYDCTLLSDGTLRVLAVAAAMLSASEGSLVVIEEIDNGVHPSRAHHLLEQIKNIAQKRNLRVVLSTHNPAMLDALPDSAIGDVAFCYRDPQSGHSRLTRLSDIPDSPELLAQGPLGHLMTSGTLERFVKNRPTPTDKKQAALSWVERMRKI